MSKTDFANMFKTVLNPEYFYPYYGSADYVLYAMVNYQFDKFKLYVDNAVDINQIQELIDVVINSDKFDYAEELISCLESESVRQMKQALMHLTVGEFLEAYHLYQIVDETTLEYPAAYYNGFGYCQAALGDFESAEACLEAACKIPAEKRRGIDMSSYNTAMLHAFIPYARGNTLVASTLYYKLLTSMETNLHPMCYRLNMCKSMLAKCYMFARQWDFANNLIRDISNQLRESAGWYNHLVYESVILSDISDLCSGYSDHDTNMVSLAEFIKNTKCQFWQEESAIALDHFTHDIDSMTALRDRYSEQYGPGFYRVNLIDKLLKEEVIVPERLTLEQIKERYPDQWVALADVNYKSNSISQFNNAIVVCGMTNDEYDSIRDMFEENGKSYLYIRTKDSGNYFGPQTIKAKQ